MTDWAIPQQAKLKYTQLFNLHDRSRSGFLSGVQCRDILMQSGLPRNTLAEIWNLSDIDGDGQLTREEFILALHLTNQVRAGQALPAQLPADLVPPSYRRQRSISSASVHSATSAGSSISGSVVAAATTSDDQAAQRSGVEVVGSSSGQAGSILNSNSFEDKRRENFEKGRAELERRRLKIIEQQTSILSEQLVRCKKQVAEAKSKIDAMRTERDTKAGLLTSLEAQLKTVRDRRAFLDHEEVQIIAIAKDLNLVNSVHSADLDQQATHAKQESISQMKENLAALVNEKEDTIKRSTEAQARVDALRGEYKALSEEAGKEYGKYKEQIAKAKALKKQFAEENKSRLVDLDSAWDAAAPSFSSSPSQQSSSTPAAKPSSEQASTFSTAIASAAEDPWAPSNKQFSADPFAESNNNLSASDDFNTPAALGTSPKFNDPPFDGASGNTSSGFNDAGAPSFGTSESTLRKKVYRAIYAFDARNVDELTINPGDIIMGSEEVCEPGWLSGKIGDRVGLFPEAYVEPMPESDSFSPTAANDAFNSANITTPVSPLATNVSSQQKNISTGSYQDVEAKQQVASMPQVAKYKVVYAFEARNVDELNMNPGDIITGVEGPHEPGWLMGELNGQRGLFPEAYVEKLAETPAEQATTRVEKTGTLRRGSSSSSLRSKKSRAKKAEVATVIANYRALGQEQLNLEKGQLVLIRRKMDSGWWEGELQIKDNRQSENGGAHNARRRHANELDHLIRELVDSELDYLNDLRLCQSAYIAPLTSNSFDVSHIFTHWHRLIQVHELSLAKLMSHARRLDAPKQPDYAFVLATFESLFGSIVELYIDFCSCQNESTRQLEAKMASDIRFRQLVSESQRKLRKLIEQQVGLPPADSDAKSTASDVSPIQASEQARALRNSNLPLTSFIIKPMQRITKYGLLFERMLKAVSGGASDQEHLRAQIERLKLSAQELCAQVNEACRLKEDQEDNDRRLRWCQSHIKQQPSVASAPFDARGSFSRSSMSSGDLRVPSSLSPMSSASNDSHASACLAEFIQFNSNTNCLGPRRLIKAGSLMKLRSGRELVAFLFNDFLLLTQAKGGVSLRVENVFRSERAQQAYYKPYKPPLLLDGLQLEHFDNEQLFQSLSCPSINSSSSAGTLSKEQEGLLISFLDRQCGSIYNLVALSSKEKSDWCEALGNAVLEAQEAQAASRCRRSLLAARRLSASDSLGRLFVTVLELTRIISSPAAPQRQASLADLNSSWERRFGTLNQPAASIQNLCVRMQLRLYKRGAPSGSGEHSQETTREVLPLSEEFQTDPVVINDLRRQPVMAEMNESMSNLEVQRDKFKFENDSTQFLIPSQFSSSEQNQEYLDIELIDDSRFRETRLIGRKRISLDQLLGRGTRAHEHRDLSRKLSSQSSRSIQAIQPNRPVDMTFKLKPTWGEQQQTNRAASQSPCAGQRSGSVPDEQQRFNLKLKFHLQLFCDTPSLI